MDRDTRAPEIHALWREHEAPLRSIATRILHDGREAEDVVQDAFARLARRDVTAIDDVRGWLTVVVRRLCLDRLRSAYARRESPATGTLPDAFATDPGADPADRVTLDDQVQLALAMVLDRLTPAERTAFVLHDVFGFPFDVIGEVVGRSAGACRQLARRARASIRSGGPPASVDVRDAAHRELTERFIAACAGGDLGELMTLLDPDVSGEAVLHGYGTVGHVISGRDIVARRLLEFFGPASGTTLVPVPIIGRPGFVAVDGGGVGIVVRLDEREGRVHVIHSYIGVR
ncbi:MAG TPA: sigma-70 family RNA polymerase sigma factor [Acidimicrobiia bacterium]|jgi:RNA polymerase sigma-70 factor (ECF subfamily)